MDPRYLRTLEFPKILEQLAGHTSFSASQEMALALTPATTLEAVSRLQQETREANYLLDSHTNTSVGGARDVRPLLEDSRRGLILSPLQFLDIKTTLLSGRTLRHTLSRQAGPCPRLADIAGRLEECAGLVKEITRCIDERGEVTDDASPELGRIRRTLRQAQARLSDYLHKLLASSAGLLQEAIITQRNGRYVIPLKAEFKGRIPGLVHDQSASGATIFIEPLAAVELNNQWRSLQIEEENEVRRILAELTELVSQEAAFIERTVVTLALIDLIVAKAKYGQALRAKAPEFVPVSKIRGDGVEPRSLATIDLRRARHPLLNPETVVPIDVHLGADYFVLVITGPNTGGKTVSLKTVGLLTAMAQAGLYIPAAEGSQLSVFETIFADIGDEQSIEQSLSTFSSHMRNIVDILSRATPQSLVLLDELGAGTDPEEGSALARSILSHLLRRNITTFATTHYSELKIYAHTVPGVRNASVEFDVETLSPTYELTIGLPGRSNAFAIARRLGLGPGIVDEAAGMISSDTLKAESLLAAIKQTQDEVQEERRRAIAARQEAESLRRELNIKLTEIEGARRDVLEEARQEARQELEALQTELERMRAQAEETLRSAGRAEELARLDEIETSAVKVAQQWQPLEVEPAPAEAGPWVAPQMGDAVWVDSLGMLGEVTDLDGEDAVVQVGSFRVNVPTRSLAVRERAPEPAQPEAVRFVSTGPRPPLELDLRGLYAEEALRRLDKYLNDAMLAGLPFARIVHGKGTGVLRQVVRERLGSYPAVTSFRTGENNEGGDGVTVVSFSKG